MEQVKIDGATVRIPDAIVSDSRWLWGAKQARSTVRLLRRGELARADEVVTGVLAGADATADWWFLSAEMARALKAKDRAATAYQRAVDAVEDVPTGWYRDLAKAYAAIDRPADAATVLAKVVDAQPAPPKHIVMELARYLTHAGQAKEARRRFGEMLDRDPETGPFDRAMLANDVKYYGVRRDVLHFVEANLTEIRAAAQVSLKGDTDHRSTLWTYWAQGWDSDGVPAVVAMCHRRLKELAGSDVVALDLDSVAELVQIPADLARLDLGHAHRSDLLRLELLGRYGGTWIDATCFVTEDPRPHLADLSKDGFFAFEMAGRLLNWLISCEADSYLIRMTRSALHAHVREHKKWGDYFLFHHVFEALVLCDEEFRRLWEASPRTRLGGPTAFMRHRTEPADQVDTEELFARSFVQKLSYRYIDDALKIPGSFMNHLIATH